MKRLKLEKLEPRKQLTGLNAASPKHAFLNLHVAEWSMGAKAYAVLTVMYPVFLQIWSKRSCKQEWDLKSQNQSPTIRCKCLASPGQSPKLTAIPIAPGPQCEAVLSDEPAVVCVCVCVCHVLDVEGVLLCPKPECWILGLLLF